MDETRSRQEATGYLRIAWMQENYIIRQYFITGISIL